MKQFRHFLGMAVVAIFAACALASYGKCKNGDGDDDKDSQKSKPKSKSSPSAVVEKFWTAMAEYDVDAVLECNAAESEGSASYLAEGLEDMKHAEMKFSLKKIKSEEVEDDEATVECVVEVSIGKKKIGKGNFAILLAKKDGKWLITDFEPDEDFFDVVEKAENEICQKPHKGNDFNEIKEREQRFMYVQGKILGEAVKKAAPDAKKVVVLVDWSYLYEPNGQPVSSPPPNFTLDGLKAGIGNVEYVIVCKEIPKTKPQMMKEPDGQEMEMPVLVDLTLDKTDWAKILKDKNIKGADVFVALAMLPVDLNLKEILGSLKPLVGKVALLYPDWNNETFKACFADGGKNMAELIAAVLVKNSANYEKNPPRDDQEAFDVRYVLATPQNYEKQLEEARKY